MEETTTAMEGYEDGNPPEREDARRLRPTTTPVL